MIVASGVGGVVEPTTISLSRFGGTSTCTAYIRIVNPNVPGFNTRIQYSFVDSFNTSSSGTLTLPPGYTDTSDPVMAHNAATSGVNPLATYMVGQTRNRSSDSSVINPTSVRVWQSGDGGFSWSDFGSEVDAIPAGTTGQIVDKPWIAVSQAPGSLGYVYVAWIRVDQTSGSSHQSQLLFRRSRNGVLKPHVCCGRAGTWDAKTSIGGLGNWQGPQIVEDSLGYVYVFWTDLTSHTILGSRSLKPGADFDSLGRQFAAAETISSFNRIGAGQNENVLTPQTTPIRALPLISAHFDAVTDRILLTWHEGETVGSANTKISYAYATPPPVGDPMVFTLIRPLPSPINTTGSDQFTPAIETDESGQVLLTYYDGAGRSDGSYQETAVLLDSAGNVVPALFPATNPTRIGPPCTSGAVGEYQAVRRGLYGGTYQWDLAWTCGDVDGTRTIHRSAMR
jgi:hypothetical protein